MPRPYGEIDHDDIVHVIGHGLPTGMYDIPVFVQRHIPVHHIAKQTFEVVSLFRVGNIRGHNCHQ